MKLGKPDKLFFFTGASAWIPDAIQYAEGQGIKCYVFAVSRHLEEMFAGTGKTFRQVLSEKNISWFHCDDINNSQELRQLATVSSIGIGLGEAYTFSTETLGLFNRRIFDFMTIRMPKYRGGAHYTWQILQQNRIGAWYIQVVNEEMVPGGYDTGEILSAYEYIIPSWARIPADYFKVADTEGLNAFRKFIDDAVSGRDFTLTVLQENFSLYLPRLYTLRHGYINWSWSGEEIERFICAFDEPYAGASTFCNGERLFLKSAQLERGEGSFHPFMNGLVYRIYNNKAFIAINNGTLIVEKISTEDGKDAMPSIKPGYRLYTPAQLLDEAMLFNAEYTSTGLK
ncbi:MAG TPA: hypothetical protein VFR58_15695 [Flavisolibacter sp.]|nr:hypothetical protein [Flavisolibacter sp.]